MINAGMMSSNTGLWSTPQDLFDRLNATYNFTLDVCAIPENAKCKRYLTPEIDGLSVAWDGICWMNPPYGRAIKLWVEKAYLESQRGCIVVALLPARTDTDWFHRWIYSKGLKIEFVRGRIVFGGAKWNAPFPSMIVEFSKK